MDDEESSTTSESNEENDSSIHQSNVIYQWLRNDESITKTTSGNYSIFPNGTLLIPYSSKAEANYRCLASTTFQDVGSVLSKSCNVQEAGTYLFYIFSAFIVFNNVFIFFK